MNLRATLHVKLTSYYLQCAHGGNTNFAIFAGDRDGTA